MVVGGGGDVYFTENGYCLLALCRAQHTAFRVSVIVRYNRRKQKGDQKQRDTVGADQNTVQRILAASQKRIFFGGGGGGDQIEDTANVEGQTQSTGRSGYRIQLILGRYRTGGYRETRYGIQRILGTRERIQRVLWTRYIIRRGHGR